MPNVSFRRQELREHVASYDLIDDVIAGEQRIKAKTIKYLPRPNASDASPENVARYDAYLKRAQFYNVTGRTLLGLIGTVFLRDPLVKIPALLQPVQEDATGTGVDLQQLAKAAIAQAISKGRGGFFVDYPRVETATTRADLMMGNIRPTINLYDAKQIINWRTTLVGGKKKLTLVVLEEDYENEDDGFEVKLKKQWRVLRLNAAGVYTQEIWRNDNAPNEVAFTPLDSKGRPFTDIPFMFFGSENNDAEIDAMPLYDMASLNIAHYRNSADYEEAVFMVGQPTPYFSGLTREWVDEVFKGKILLGSRAAVPLPAGAQAGLLQASPNTMAYEAIQHKERQMVALGAKLVEQRQVERTATEASMEETAEQSVLSTVADNVGKAILVSLAWACLFVGAAESDLAFKLNTQFDLTKLSPEERRQLMLEWQGGALTFGEYRDSLRRAGIATVPDDKAQASIREEMAANPTLNPADPDPDREPADAE